MPWTFPPSPDAGVSDPVSLRPPFPLHPFHHPPRTVPRDASHNPGAFRGP
jgi:hypothetical protein